MTQHSGNLHSATCFVACSCRQKNLQTGSSTKITQNQVTKLRPDDVISIQVKNFGRILTCDKAEICILQLLLLHVVVDKKVLQTDLERKSLRVSNQQLLYNDIFSIKLNNFGHILTRDKIGICNLF